MKFFLILICISLSLFLNLCASESELPKDKKVENKTEKSPGSSTQEGTEEAEKTVKIGNLAFPVSQQPTPLISFGQNVLNKNQAQAYVLTNEFKGDDQYFVNMVPSYIYGLTDNLTIFLSAPFAVRYRQKNHHTSGPGDALVQLEYAFYTKAYRTYYDQATIVTNITIPIGSRRKNPSIALGSNNFFIGLTYSRMKINWFYFTSHGVITTSSSHRTQHGNQFLYQFGIGRRITNTKVWLFDWMLELDGIYSWKDRINGKIDPNSGGNVIYLTPSIWISSAENLIAQFGIGFPICQSLFGHQMKNDYLLSLNVGWTF